VDKKDDYYFMDFSTDYKLIKNKLTVGLQGKNLFDTRTFKRYSISDIGSSVTKYRLLPRMLLFTAEYRF
jgi:outer membrane receptor protein involved in Fe transport